MIQYFEQEKLDDFLDSIGYAIFYNESVGNTEEEIYLYSLLSQYYLEIGADKSGFETILHGRRLKNFYKIQNIEIRSQALHAYGRFLLFESDFEDALKAEKQLEDDANVLLQENHLNATHYLRRALAFKAYVMMMQGKTEDSYELACEIFEKYYDKNEDFSHITTYDFLLPIYWIRTEWAIRNRDYEQAIVFCKEYGKLCKKYNFRMNALSLSKELMFALPEAMSAEREKLFRETALDADFLAQNFLDYYTDSTDEKLFAVIENLKYKEEKNSLKNQLIHNLLIVLIMLVAFLLILISVYSETQTDGLTKLRNRRALNIRLGKLASSGKKYSAIMIDIDNFKKLNDNFGHDFGDEVLRGVAVCLISKESKNVKCYRYGGEEMVVILEHFNLEQAVRFSENVRTEISSMKWKNDVHVTASFGLGFEMPDSLKEADENMYVAKQKGKNFTAYKKDGKQYLAERRLDIRNPMPDKF